MTPALTEESRSDISILDESDPFSLINIVPHQVKDAMKRASLGRADLFTMNEEEFIQTLRKDETHFNSTDHMIRDQFWIEFHHARANGKPMALTRIISGAISREGFINHYLRNNLKVAFLCVMPMEYRQILKRNLTQLARNMSRIADLPVIDPQTGKLDKAVAALQFSLYKMVEVTLHGTPTQRIEQKSLSLSVTRHEGSAINGQIEHGREKTLIERIKDLERREREAAHLPVNAEFKTVEATSVKMGDKGE